MVQIYLFFVSQAIFWVEKNLYLINFVYLHYILLYAFLLIYRQRKAYLSATQSLSIGNAKLIYRQRKAYLSAMQSLSIGNAKLICRQRNSIASAMYLKIPERVKVKSF